jgi:hypothetical protein
VPERTDRADHAFTADRSDDEWQRDPKPAPAFVEQKHEKPVPAGAERAQRPGTAQGAGDARSPVDPDPLRPAVPAYDQGREKKQGSLLGIVISLVAIAAVVGIVGGFWFLQGRFPGAEQPAPVVVADRSVPDDRGGQAESSANGAGALNPEADRAPGAPADAAGAPAQGDVAGAADVEVGDGVPIAPNDRTMIAQTGRKVGAAGEADNVAAEKVVSDERSGGTLDEPAAQKSASETAPGSADEQARAPVSGRAYGVHVESFPTRGEADEAAERYEAAGMPVTITAVNVPGKGLWHRVILGRVASRAEADQLSRDIKQRFDLRYTLVVRVGR